MNAFSFLARSAPALVLVTGVVAAQAQTPNAQQVGERLIQADSNHDGLLDRNEVADMPRLKRNFDKIDTDKNGRLSKAELQAAGQKLRQRQQTQ